MRRLIILALATLATAAASVASAQPRRVTIEERDRPGYYEECYDRYGRRLEPDRWRGRWMTLSEETSATSERQFINVLGRGGRMDRLILEGASGTPMIERVAVEFADRQTQVWDLNRRLRPGADAVIELGGPKRIHRIIVYTDPRYRGSYSIYGT